MTGRLQGAIPPVYDDRTAVLIMHQDHVLIAIQDGKPVPEEHLRSLPPWRAALLADVAVRASLLEPEKRDAIRAEATRVGGAGRLSPAVVLPMPFRVPEGRHPGTRHFERLFAFEHLPQGLLQSTSARFALLAQQLVDSLPDDPELTAGLRKLLEAKDCFVRAALGAVPAEPELPVDWYHRHGTGAENFTYCESHGPARAHCVEAKHHIGHHTWDWFTEDDRMRGERLLAEGWTA